MKLTIGNIIIILCFLTIASTSNAQKVFYSQENKSWDTEISEDADTEVYSVYLIGDLKNPLPHNENLELLKSFLSKEKENSSVVILGDIVYPLGLPDSTDKGFNEALAKHKQILHTFDNYKGRVVFVPGNHDWARGKSQGWENILNQEEFIEKTLNKGNTYVPDGGCPGPLEIPLSDDLTLIVFDSHWYFHKFDKPGLDGECGFEDEKDMFVQIEDALRRNRDKKVIFAAHHPLYSVGYHGGYFPFYSHLFPMVEVANWMYFPLPGFIYTGYRKYLGNIQDIAHPEYKIFKAKMMEILKDYPNVIYAAGHEHNLQYFNIDSIHQIISGGGGEGTYIAGRKKKTDFAFDGRGFSKISFYANGNVWMEFISPDTDPKGKRVFCKKLFNKEIYSRQEEEIEFEELDFSDSTVIVKISDIYNKGGFVRFWMGDNYRAIWDAKVKLPVFDIGQEKAGLRIIKRGGGQQTRSIRMEDKHGKQFVLRSVNKYVEKALDDNMQNTIAVDAVQDGISASHPYAAITVPELAEAAGVMHTNPRIVWVPDDPRLGIYREEMANGIFLFEERPAGNRDDINSFGNSEKIVNTAKVIDKTQDDQDHMVDQEAVLQARLFDILINDWDRHDDQWRWATFDKGKKTIYKPIPRDRDQVYFVNEGPIMWLITRNWALRKFQGFDYDIKDVRGLGFNARYFDRSFLTKPDLNDWISMTKNLQGNMTDEVIHKAIKELPENIYALSGEEIESKLRSRRDILEKNAREYYLFLAKRVDVVGTDERELFEVKRRENGTTDVDVFALSKKKGRKQEKLYHREFKTDETREIRLYGLKGKDKFHLTGEGKKGIMVRIIPGKGNDSIIDESRVRSCGKKTIVYEKKDKKNFIRKSSETRLIMSNDKSIDDYNRKQFKFNKTMPIVLAGYNIDDGVFIGGGVNIKRFNFRDSTIHKIRGRLAFMTAAFSLSYKGLYSSFSRIFDLEFDADISAPRNVDNFFGLGNETRNDGNKKFYRVRYTYAWANPRLKHTLSDDVNYSFGAFYQYFKVTDTANRYIGELYPNTLDTAAYEGHHYTGLNAKFTIDTRNDKVLPKRGLHWETTATGFYSIVDEGENFIRLRSDLSFYLSFKRDPRFVFAFRFGGASNIGDYEFFHANFEGGKANLRGFRSNRFAGDHSFYQNTEIRIKLMNIRTYVFNGQTGLLLFNDIGRVWLNGEKSERWHDGYGIGIWLTPFEFTAITVSYNRSYEDSMVDFTLRFAF